jgi:hypothetical protein
MKEFVFALDYEAGCNAMRLSRMTPDSPREE